MKGHDKGWRIVLWFVATYHLLLGLLLLFSGELSIKALKTLAGAHIEGSPQLGIAGEILACYILAFGLMMATAAWNPVKNRAMISIGLLLIALRLFQRVYFADKVMRVFQVPAANYWSATALAALLGLLLAAFRLRIYRQMQASNHPESTRFPPVSDS